MYTWASYLFGGSPAPTEDAIEEVNFRTMLADDNWEIVDTRGASPHRMEESPMENLLIEHSSMSVYVVDRKENVQESDSKLSKSFTKAESKNGKLKCTKQGRSQRRPKAVAERLGIISIVQTLKPQQKVQKRKEHKKNSKSHLSRLNKVQRPALHQRNASRQIVIRQPNKKC